MGKQEKNNQIYVYKNLIFNHVLFQWIQREFFDWLSDWEKEINDQDISEMEKSCWAKLCWAKLLEMAGASHVSEFIIEFAIAD